MEAVKHELRTDSLFTLAGTVGVGKSSLTNRLAEALEMKPAFEKVEGNPYLEDYYDDFKKWSFHLQMYFLAERFKQQKHMHEQGMGYVQDRSIYEDVGIFAQLQYDQGNMTERDFNTYHSLFEAMVMNPYFPKPDVLIYIDGSFESIMRRIEERGREMEIQTPRDFWLDLHQRYQIWINQFNECPVLHLDIDYYDCFDPDSIKSIVRALEKLQHDPSQRRLYLS
ncbi:deoxynucleoside kinase [Salisediminibacterium halotolerans]|uniref:Deoxyadenosine/deoxycytidine kinase n=1 Tax=Salisediminibacterium halotolerans TaxID=517425 RepID=A0A1H9NYJ3_9BACI|nr:MULTISPECIES: deoxynucleoside kinase [Salisediminibacterium]RLJ77880.1 deoxyadenosine/deoxycytidine kinase [Actinophytocola xinjiangensis]RPE88782.1 deoxyadenosine/deoxycytidine kinase [Salisediminibacterium halotolerans]TWG36857.1 deoxyadenosine/deoxycytidine kinase [Salisediminibacterium halotolerans]SER40403.1 deoxyadenosine/deoxycytidine kinase [Salisediminibacterium haloalkalitolerans]GEL08411.1 deoxycytidine kinase [Salisediminibacterium halotolerans]